MKGSRRNDVAAAEPPATETPRINRPDLILLEGGLSVLESRVRALLEKANIALPVRFEFAERIKSAETELKAIAMGANVWKVGDHIVKFRKGAWTSSRPGWKKSEADSIEIILAKIDAGVLDSAPYDILRRRHAPMYIYELGDRKESTRRNHADRIMMTRFDQIVEEVARIVGEAIDAEDAARLRKEAMERERDGLPPLKPKRGPKEIPTALAIYAIIQMCWRNLSFRKLAHLLENDPACQQLGWNRRRGPRRAALRQKLLAEVEAIADELDDEQLVGPGRNTLDTVFGRSSLTRALRRVLALTVFPGRFLDDTVIVDSHEVPTFATDNSRNAKFHHGKRRGPMVKVHFAVGKYSLLAPAIFATMNRGLGSGDGPWLRFLAIECLAAFVCERLTILGDKAYRPKGNYDWCQDHNVKLLTRIKRNEVIENGWCTLAVEVAVFQEQLPTEFKNEMRFRNKGEGFPARQKGTTRSLRLRKRKDALPIVPADSSDDVLCNLNDRDLWAILDRATASVGAARINEVLGFAIRDNIHQLVVLEQLHDQRVVFDDAMAFRRIRVISEEKLLDSLKPAA